jgi:hypothetical protein
MDADTQLGFQALQAFHNASLRYPDYGMSFEQFKSHYGKRLNAGAEGIGLQARVLELSWSDVKEKMEDLASEAKGRLPADVTEFSKYIGKDATQINWFKIIGNSAVEVGAQVGGGVVSFGNQVITGLSWINRLLPFLIVGGALYYLWSFAPKGKSFSEIKALVKKAKKVAKS